MSADSEQVLAFAAMFQALGCVHELAEHGRCNADDAQAVIDAIFAIDSANAESLYPATRLKAGLAITARQLEGNSGDAIMRMGVTILRLERRLMSNAKLAATLRERIADSERTRTAMGPQHESVHARLAEAYAQTVSNLQPRVMVTGSPLHLQQERTIQQIRALLLAAIRAAAMWRHVGGSGWRLFWRRKLWLDLARKLGDGPVN